MNLINRSAVKQLIMDKCRALRPGWPCERVSAEALDSLEAALRAKIVSQVQGHPTIGRTFKPSA